jgi:hypothetical protein
MNELDARCSSRLWNTHVLLSPWCERVPPFSMSTSDGVFLIFRTPQEMIWQEIDRFFSPAETIHAIGPAITSPCTEAPNAQDEEEQR